ncbi:Cupredoxin [Pseudomassariella vexata]|uniref:Cupredoxin n=1 Tax=Pseudomassariella vexata TaxID=1141098 RepID=A0A1Y2DBT2_9PEZI|nr:Cupredoxin [Pseudomassariella vexata]ORY56604.1 Cupredoxin [Pseudomassariella vexata]
MKYLNLAFTAGLAAAATIRIDSGPGLVFKPEDITAKKGDILEFHFLPINHSVAQGDFNNPCQMPTSGGFFSGYIATKDTESPTVFRVTVNDTEPIWFYCTQNFHSHCQGGMVGVVNAPSGTSGNNTLAAYKSAAANFQGMAGDAMMAFGGEVMQAGTSTGGSGTGSGTGTNTVTTPSASMSNMPGMNMNAAGNVKVATMGVLGALGLAVFGLA